ncbi:MAG TPA: PEGA domain-containing protein [Kofleriaceae bacterium]
MGVLALVGVASVAHAQKPDAGALFEKGRDLFKAGKYADACAAFSQSEAIQPELGTEYNLANCDAMIGKLATALATYRDLAQRDTNAPRREDEVKRAQALEPRVPKLAIAVAPSIPGTTVTSNGADVTATLNTPTPVDLGTYAVVAHAPGYADAHATATVADEGKTVAITLQLVGKPEVPLATAPPPPVAPPPPPLEPAEPANPAHARHVVAISVAAAGVALVATGLVFGELASSKLSAAKSICPDLDCTSESDLSAATADTNAAKTRGDISTALVAVGAAAVGAGVVLWLTAPSAESSGPSARLVPHASPRDVGLALEGRF